MNSLETMRRAVAEEPQSDVAMRAFIDCLIEEDGLTFCAAVHAASAFATSVYESRQVREATDLMSVSSDWREPLKKAILDAWGDDDGSETAILIASGESSPRGAHNPRDPDREGRRRAAVIVGAAWVIDAHARLIERVRDDKADGVMYVDPDTV